MFAIRKLACKLAGSHQVLVEFARPDGVVEAALVTVLQDEPGFQQFWPSISSGFLDVGSCTPVRSGHPKPSQGIWR